MLSIKTRKEYLNYLGLYNGPFNNTNTAAYRKAVRTLQNTYFPERYQTGKYAKWTDILLRNAVRVKQHTKNFDLTEFACGCGGRYCTRYPEIISISLLKYAQRIRDNYGQSMYITSALRCEKYNNTLEGSVKGSKHTKGKAIDFYTVSTSSLAYRKRIMDYYIKLANASYSYCDSYTRTKLRRGTISAPYMGSAIHIDVI